jgi:hypothetical protein
MIKHTLEKIDKLLKEKEYDLPEIILKLYSFLLHFAKRLEQKGSEYLALDHYADALKLFRKLMVDEPFKLTKITTPEISKAIAIDSFEHLSNIFELRNRFLKDLANFAPTDAFGKKVVSEMTDLKWVKKMHEPLEGAELLKKHMEQKKGNKSYVCELTTLLWFG